MWPIGSRLGSRLVQSARGSTSFSLHGAVSSAKVQVQAGDLVSDGGHCDLIVNSANETLEGPLFPYFPIGAECESGDVYYQDEVVDGRIHKAAGPALGRLCRRLPELPPDDDPNAPFPSPYTQRCEIGGARLTEVPEGSELARRCKYVAHAVVPMWAGDLDLQEQNRRINLLRQAYSAVFSAAQSASTPVRRICSPLLGAGAKQFPVDLAARCAREAVLLELQNPMLMDLEVITFIDIRVHCVDLLVQEQSWFKQDFAELEDALGEGVWEVEGDNLYFEAKDASSGAVVASEGGVGSIAELVHQLNKGLGCQATNLTMALICEAIDVDSDGTFTVGLAFDEDFEETALLAVTLRRPRPEPKLPREPGDPPEDPEMPRPIVLQVNGQVACEDVGELPVKIELDVQLCWDEKRTAVLRHRLLPVDRSEMTIDSIDSLDIEAKATSTGFYTTDANFDVAKAVFLRATGTVQIRLLSLQCGPLNAS
ncbi:unnamed protein product [Symbiodinium pilosum]|uniref:Macro domain-containing protein n=1 Tax=Symbiodinium pilosum TaxID=2952 RepID=A0A812YIC6_SYMPI|nr:unnamed protein product [Symbiodinium pilosum]